MGVFNAFLLYFKLSPYTTVFDPCSTAFDRIDLAPRYSPYRPNRQPNKQSRQILLEFISEYFILIYFLIVVVPLEILHRNLYNYGVVDT